MTLSFVSDIVCGSGVVPRERIEILSVGITAIYMGVISAFVVQLKIERIKCDHHVRVESVW